MNLFAFPFYDAINKQARFNSACRNLGDYDLFSPANRFLPFQITKPSDGQLIDCIKVFDLDSALVLKIEPDEVNYQMFSDGEFDYMFYYAGIITGMNLDCGRYYLQIGSFFSEVFTVANVSTLVKIEWQHSSNIGRAIYQSGFLQHLYLDTVISEPKYPTKQEEEENGYGETIPTLTTVSKRFILDTGLLPEFLIDALAALPLHADVTIGQYIKVKSIQTEPDWLVPGCLAKMEIQFNEAEITSSKICTDVKLLSEIIREGYRPKGWLCGDNSDTTAYWQPTGETRCVTVEATGRATAWRGINPYCETE